MRIPTYRICADGCKVLAKSFSDSQELWHQLLPLPFLHPARAAFAAADIEGIYFQAELPLWGSISPDNHRLNDFLLNEAYMTLDYMGNHPSFTMLGLGNELGGDVD